MPLNIRTSLALAAAGTLFAGCATPPSLIAPEPVSGGRYLAMSCEELEVESARLQSALDNRSKQQIELGRERAGELALELGIGIPLTAVAIISGYLASRPIQDLEKLDIDLGALTDYDDLSPDVASLKGEIAAAQRLGAHKRCSTV